MASQDIARKARPSSFASKARRQRALEAYLFLLPALALIGVFTLIPFVQGIVLSFQSWDGVSTDTPFVGFDNYLRVFQDNIFWSSMLNAVIFGAVGLLIGGALSLGMAMAVNKAKHLSAFFRTAYYVPGVFSVVVVGMMFSWLLDPRIGIVNRLLGAIGLDWLQHNWLNDADTSIWAVAAVFVWYHWGFGFLLFLAGLQDIPKEYYEAAELDGAPAWARFRYITWPDLAPVTTIVSILTLLGGLQIFGTVQVLTNGGPGYHTEVPTLRIYKEAFEFQRYGSAAAMSVVFGLALVALSLFQLWISRRSNA
jgi:multiple sugar transport system permease protein/raffinose/stachyose/melibiose transport system permease protein